MKIMDPQGDEESAVNLTPLIDMVFLLLIFFLVATTFAQEERDRNINLPGSDSKAPLSDPPKQLIINITAEGIVKVGGEAYDEPKLLAMLQTVVRDDPGREVLIRADQKSIHRYFARVADIVHRAGINKTKIGYARQKSGK